MCSKTGVAVIPAARISEVGEVSRSEEGVNKIENNSTLCATTTRRAPKSSKLVPTSEIQTN